MEKKLRMLQLALKYHQARSQDLEKGGAILKEWEECKRPWPEFSLFLSQFHTVCPKIETKFLGKLGISKVFSAQKHVVSKKKKKKGFHRNWDWVFGRNPKFKVFFRPNTDGLQKKKKKVFTEIETDFSAETRNSKVFSAQKQVVSNKKKKKRFSPKLRLIFRLVLKIHVWGGGCFPMGGANFNFSQKIGLKSTKNVRFCIIHMPMGGLEPLPPHGYATEYHTGRSRFSQKNGCGIHESFGIKAPRRIECSKAGVATCQKLRQAKSLSSKTTTFWGTRSSTKLVYELSQGENTASFIFGSFLI